MLCPDLNKLLLTLITNLSVGTTPDYMCVCGSEGGGGVRGRSGGTHKK